MCQNCRLIITDYLQTVFVTLFIVKFKKRSKNPNFLTVINDIIQLYNKREEILASYNPWPSLKIIPLSFQIKRI